MICPTCSSEECNSRGYKDNGKHQYYCTSKNHPYGYSRFFVVDDRNYDELPEIKIGVVDIETLPGIAYVWGMYDQNISQTQLIEESCLLSWAGKFLNHSEVYGDVLSPKEAVNRNPKRISLSAYDFISQCQIVIGHNWINFDGKTLNNYFLMYANPVRYQVIDTLQVARNNFKFMSNKLSFINEKLGIRNKVDNSGFSLWKGCSEGDKKSLQTMMDYNFGDILATEELYYKLRSFIPNHPNLAKYNEIEDEQCPVCLGTELNVEGVYYTKQYESLRCSNCGSISRRKSNLFSKNKRKNLLSK